MNQDLQQQVKAEGFDLVIGVDEAGRGPLAGPVVAAAVALKIKDFQSKIRDSKTLSPRQRRKAFDEIYDKAYVGVGIISEAVIDRINILEATFLAMTNAVENLVARVTAEEGRQPNVCLLVDGSIFRASMPYPFRTVVHGDARVKSIACASIVAKVTRDRIMEIYDTIYPQYGFQRHKGYPTAKHREVLRLHGPSMIHRKSFHTN